MKKNVIRSLPFKLTAFILTVVSLVLAVGCTLGSLALYYIDAYNTSREEFRNDWLWSMTYPDRHTICSVAGRGALSQLDELFGESNLLYRVYDAEGNLLATNVESTRALPYFDVIGFDLTDYDSVNDVEPYHGDYEPQVNYKEFMIELDFRAGFPYHDQYAEAAKLLDFAWDMRYAAIGIAVAGALLAIVLIVLLMWGAGRRNDSGELALGPVARMPLDLLTVIVAALVTGASAGIVLSAENMAYGSVEDVPVWLALCAALALAMAAVALGWGVSLAVRLKQGGWWKNTVVFHLARLVWKTLKFTARWLWKALKFTARWLWKLLRWLGRGVRGLFRGIGALLRGIPLVWKTAVAFMVLSIINLIVVFAFAYEPSALVFVWFVESMVLGVGVIWFALRLRRLQRGGQALADGDLSHQVDTAGLFWDLKAHGENLNSIALGMNKAVEARMKSERLKTELITNVSHDIKTPLTSIINYVDLLSREPTDNETITEYCGVLQRQSERLKKLITDLVDASKASTGNLEVQLAPCEVGVLLTQTAGEYERRINERELNLIVRKPERELRILADGRLLWRVFDNLMNNVCKYAQEHTRVYLSLEEMDGKAVVTFKNTSKYALDIPGEELLERFVRGDSSRSTEGSGLGLSIAQSLTELQGGALALTIDGDLFKVALRFPLLGAEARHGAE